MFQDPFADLIPQRGAPGVGAPPLELVVPPRPRLPPPQTPEQARGDVLGNERTEIENTRAGLPPGFQWNADRTAAVPIAGTPQAAEAETTAAARQRREQGMLSAREKLRNVVLNARQAIELSRTGWFTTGTGSQLPAWGGSQAADLEALLGQIGANTAFEEIQRLQRESTTGATGLGPISNVEFTALRDAVASLSRTQSDEQFQAQMNNIINLYENAYRQLGGNPRELADPATMAGRTAAAGIVSAVNQDATPPNGSFDARGRGISNQGELGTMDLGFNAPDRLAEGQRLTPEQYTELQQFVRTRPNAQQINEWFQQRGYAGVTNPERLAEQIAAGDFSTIMNYGEVDRAAQPDISDERTPGQHEGFDPFMRGAADVLTLGHAEEAAAAVDTLAGGGTYEQNLMRQRQIDAHDNQGWSRLGGQVTAGFLLPMPRVTAGENLGVLARYGPQMRASAGYAGGYGFGSGDGDLATRGTNAALMTGVGAVAPPVIGEAVGVLGRGAQRMLGRGPRSAGNPNPEVIQAFQEEGIDFARPFADVTRRQQMRVLGSTQGGADEVAQSVEGTRSSLQGRVDEMRAVGNRQTADEMGTTVRGSVERRVEALRTRARNFYNGAEEQSAGVTILPRDLVNTLDASIANLRRNPNTNKTTIDELMQVRADLVDGRGNLIPKTVQDIQNIREGISGGVNQTTLRTTRSERILNAALHAGRRDVERDLGQQAPAALRLYQQGDETWARMHRDSRQLLERLTGPADNPISGAEALGRVTRMMSNRGDAQRYRRVMSTMTPDERRDYVATLADTLGRRAADEDFSPALFVSQTRGWSDEALRTTFGRDGARSIANLRTASMAFRDTTGNANNVRSGLGIQASIGAVVNFRAIVGNALGIAVGALSGGPAGAAAGSAIGQMVGMAAERRANRISAQALMNPDISRWMRLAARAENTGQVNTRARELVRIARRNPALAQELEPLINQLSRAANDNVPRAGSIAANSPNQGPNNPNQEANRQ